MMADHKGLPIISFASATDWEAWLTDHGAASPGVWLKFAKKGSGVPSVGKAEAIEAALAHGWIDGQLDKLDEPFWLVRFTPRSRTSKWSKINRDTAARLIAQGQMKAAGLEEVDRAKRDGRWAAAYPPQSAAEVPPDLQVALEASPEAKAFFASLTGANRYAILYRIHDAKTAATRAARIERFVLMLAQSQTLHPPAKARRELS
jgi:uncharacterized protein YdeI (YjbR/CyaY-like superfamily)